jgi:hypothetical protein
LARGRIGFGDAAQCLGHRVGARQIGVRSLRAIARDRRRTRCQLKKLPSIL